MSEGQVIKGEEINGGKYNIVVNIGSKSWVFYERIGIYYLSGYDKDMEVIFLSVVKDLSVNWFIKYYDDDNFKQCCFLFLN